MWLISTRPESKLLTHAWYVFSGYWVGITDINWGDVWRHVHAHTVQMIIYDCMLKTPGEDQFHLCVTGVEFVDKFKNYLF